MADRGPRADREHDADRTEPSDVDVPDPRDQAPEPASPAGDGLRSRLGGGAFSAEHFLVGVAVAILGAFFVARVLPLGDLAVLIGIWTGSFLHGAVAEGRHYLEAGLAGGLVGGIWILIGNLAGVVLGVGIPVVAVGVVGGLLAGLAGQYNGRDLRHGLTREL